MPRTHMFRVPHRTSPHQALSSFWASLGSPTTKSICQLSYINNCPVPVYTRKSRLRLCIGTYALRTYCSAILGSENQAYHLSAELQSGRHTSPAKRKPASPLTVAVVEVHGKHYGVKPTKYFCFSLFFVSS